MTRAPTARLTGAEATQARELVQREGVGAFRLDSRTLFKALAEQPVHRLTVAVVRERLNAERKRR